MDILTILPLFFAGMRGWQFIIVVLLILLLFGGKKIPELMKGLGKGVHSFKQGMAEAKKEMEKPIDDETEKAPEQTRAKDSDR